MSSFCLIEKLEPRRLLSATLVKDLVPGTSSSFPNYLTNVNGTLFFVGPGGLWKSDGTSAGTKLVKASTQIDYGASGFQSLGELVSAQGKLFFIANGADFFDESAQLWKSDGTSAGTVKLADITSSSGLNGDFGEYGLTAVNNRLYFKGVDNPNGGELWTSDGTSAGTHLLKDIAPGSDYSNPHNLIDFNGTLFFVADDGVHGPELWKSNGTALGTVMVKDISSDARGGYDGPTYLTVVNSTLFFQASDDGFLNSELWRSDGTAFGTYVVKEIEPDILGSDPTGLTNVNGILYFSADGGLWKSDGTFGGTVLVRASTSAEQLTNFNGSLFFASGGDLWKSNGTNAGTIHVHVFPTSANPGNFLVSNGAFYFTANDGVTGNELWTSDGTSSGTKLVADVNVGGDSSPANLVASGIDLYFTANDGVHGIELWRTTVPFLAYDAANRILSIHGTDGKDKLLVDLFFEIISDAQLEITLNGRLEIIPIGSGTLHRQPVDRILIDTGAGDDLIDFTSVSIPTYCNAGIGNDRIYAGAASDTLTGGAGKDTLYGGDGDDRMNGNGSHDKLYGEGGSDRLYGGDGNDTLDGGIQVDRLFGGNGNDQLFGGSSNDKLYGEAGGDTLKGQGQSDLMDGGNGSDTVYLDDIDPTPTNCEHVI